MKKGKGEIEEWKRVTRQRRGETEGGRRKGRRGRCEGGTEREEEDGKKSEGDMT